VCTGDDRKKTGWFPAGYLAAIDDVCDNEDSTFLNSGKNWFLHEDYLKTASLTVVEIVEINSRNKVQLSIGLLEYTVQLN